MTERTRFTQNTQNVVVLCGFNEFRVPTLVSCFRVLVAALLGLATSAVEAQQTFIGTLSDAKCGASHPVRAANETNRQCALACITALHKYVLVDRENKVFPIANQDVMGLPLYAGRPVRITGDLRGDAVFVATVEAIPAHLHIGHVMTNGRDTPGARGFLPVAVDEGFVALQHARLAARSVRLEDVQLHAGHVLHALDPGVEPKGPGAGYGVKKAVAGATLHLGFAVTAEGATANLATQAPAVLALLASATQKVDQAIATAQRVRSATDMAAASTAAADLVAMTERIAVECLEPARTHMNQLLKAEGLLGAPR